MRRARVFGVIGLAIVVALIAWWKLRGDSEEQRAAGTTAPPASTSGTTVATKKGPRAPVAKSAIAGRVIRKDGSGVPGARVLLTQNLTISGMMAAGGPQKGESEKIEMTAITNERGEFVISDVPAMTYLVGATARGVGAGHTEATLPPGGRADGVTITLVETGILVKGTVTDVLGGPIADARIAAMRFGGMSIRGFSAAMMATDTDDKGTYELLVPAGAYIVTANHDEYAAGSTHVELIDVPVTADFTLTPGATIKGIVVTRDGTPVPEATVSTGKGPVGFGGGGATADDKGAFTLRGLEPGAIELSAAGGDYSSSSPTIVEVGLGEQVEGVRVVVDKGLTISGRVIEKTSKKGVPGVMVGMFSMAGESAIARDATDDAGEFVIRGARAGSFLLFAFGDNVVPEMGKSVTVEDKDVTDVVIEMESGVSVRGRVEPPMEASIGLSSPGFGGIGDLFSIVKVASVNAKSDPTTGEFTLEHVPAGSFSVTAKTSAGMKGAAPTVVAAIDVSGVIIKLEQRASLSGRVVDSKGAPVDGVTVDLDKKKAEVEAVTISFDGSMGGTRTRADGSFTHVGLDAGVYAVTVRDDDGRVPWASPANKDRPTEPIEITVADKEAKTGVVLTIEARDGVIKGVAMGPVGKPAPDTWITPSRMLDRSPEPAKPGDDKDDNDDDERPRRNFGGDLKPVLSAADGRFTITRLRKGTYKLVGQSANGAARGELEKVKVGDNVTLKLGRLGELAGVVTNGGAPVPAYEIVCERPGNDDEERRRISDPKGAYKLERLAPGEYTCSVDADAGFVSAKTTVPAGPATLDLALHPWASIRGRVVSVLSGAPVAGVKVLTATKGAETGSSRQLEEMLTGGGPTTDAAGAFTVPRVTPGTGDVKFMPAKGGFTELASREYTAAEGQNVDLGTVKIIPPREGDAGTLGMSTADVNGELVVDNVVSDGPAATAGVKQGDKIASINGIPVATITAKIASAALASGTIGVGTRFALGIDRGGTPLQIAVTSVKW